VYTEFLLKKNNDNLYWQNVQLYGFGALFNAMRLTYDDVNAGFENGRDRWTPLATSYHRMVFSSIIESTKCV
jgi:UDP-sugar transporter A1/2/3